MWESTLHLLKGFFKTHHQQRPPSRLLMLKPLSKYGILPLVRMELVIYSKGYCGNLSYSCIPNQQDLFSSLRHSQSSYFFEFFRLWKPAFGDEDGVRCGTKRMQEAGWVPWECISTRICNLNAFVAWVKIGMSENHGPWQVRGTRGSRALWGVVESTDLGAELE